MSKNKKNPNAKFAFAGLSIAAAACITTGLIGAVRVMIAAQLFPQANAESLKTAFNISWPFILVGLALYAIFAPEKIREQVQNVE